MRPLQLKSWVLPIEESVGADEMETCNLHLELEVSFECSHARNL